MAFEESAHVLGPQNIIVLIENGGNSLGKFIFIHRKYLKRTNEKKKKKRVSLFSFFFFFSTRVDVSSSQNTRVAWRVGSRVGSGRVDLSKKQAGSFTGA